MTVRSNTIEDYRGIDGPGVGAASVTPNDSTDLTIYSRALYIGGDGNVKVTMFNGDEVTFVGLIAGTLLPVRAKRVWSTGTTATNIVAVY